MTARRIVQMMLAPDGYGGSKLMLLCGDSTLWFGFPTSGWECGAVSSETALELCDALRELLA